MEVKLCECGCGQPAPIAKKSCRKYGYRKGEPQRFVRWHVARTKIKKYGGDSSPPLCACGCGQLTKITLNAYPPLGIKKGDYCKFLHGHGFKVFHKKRYCKIEGCGLPYHCRGFCRMHYGRYRKHSPNMCPGKIECINKGNLNGMWKGDNATPAAGRDRARRLFSLGKCELCSKPAVDRHHKDGNTCNNKNHNVQRLCRRCHMVVDGRYDRAIANLKASHVAHKKWALSSIKSSSG